MSYYIRDGVDLKEVPLHKVETLMNAGITIISDKDIIKELKQQLESCQNELSGISGQLKEAVEVIEWYSMPSINHHAYHDVMGTNLNIKAEQFLAKYRREK